MITLNKLMAVLFVIVLSLGLYSCQESELESLENSEEGFESITGNSDSELEVVEDVEVLELPGLREPIFHASYDGSLSEEEALARYKVDEAKFLKEYVKNHKGVSTEWFYRINLRTGTQSNNETNGKVSVYVRFKTDKGYLGQRYTLPNAGRYKGRWDWYTADTYYPGQAVRWVQVYCAQLALQGTDAWFPTNFVVGSGSWYQNVPATGNSRILKEPNVWLDSNTSSGWDTYWTCDSRYRGLLSF